MLPKPINDGILRIFSIDDDGGLLQENHTILLNNSILSAANNKSSPYFSNMYYVLIDRFFNEEGDSILFNDLSVDSKVNFHGGDFLGLAKKINNGYFNRLGINNLILSPINTNPDSPFRSDIAPHRKHMGFDGSWPIDSRSIDSRFGTVDELKGLIADSHYHGLGMYLDCIVGHAHTNHSYHNLHLTWFTSKIFGNKSFLPQLDFLNSEVIMQVSSDIVHWMSEFDFDGIHYSSTDNTSSKFWHYLNRSLYSEISRDYLKIDNQIISKHGSQFNLTLYHKARDHFSGLNTNFQNLNNFIRTNFNEFGPINLMGTVTTLQSDPKFISVADGHIGYEGTEDHRVFVNFPEKVAHASSYEKLFMFFLMNNSLPGIPILFHGDEYGEIGIGESDSKRDLKFQNKLNFLESKLKNKISRLNSIRNQYPSLSIGDFFVLRESLDYSVWIKSYFGEHTIIFFNLQDKTIELNIPLPFESKKLISLLDDKIIELDNPKMASIVIPPYQSGIFLLDLK
jgi:alpha-amylase